jgi:hypothetical protein
MNETAIYVNSVCIWNSVVLFSFHMNLTTVNINTGISYTAYCTLLRIFLFWPPTASCWPDVAATLAARPPAAAAAVAAVGSGYSRLHLPQGVRRLPRPGAVRQILGT